MLGGYLDCGHPGGVARLPRRRQRVVLGVQRAVECFVERLRVRLCHADTLSDTLFRVHDPQDVGDLRAHHRAGEFAERRDELRPVRRFGIAQVMGNLVQHHQFAQRPRARPWGTAMTAPSSARS